MKRFVTYFLIMAAGAVSAEKQPFERYQSIVDRQMFGPNPPGFDPTKLPSEVQKSSVSEKELTQEQAKLQSAVHFSVLDVRPNGDVVVGFTDNSDPKVPRNYFLKVGESRDGWTVKEADPDAATMTIVKDDIEVSLSLGGNSAKGAGSTSKAGSAAATAPSRPSLLGGLLGGGSLRSRRQARREAERAEREKEAAAAAEKEAERQAQAEQEKQQHAAALAEQRQQLMAIQEELKRVREVKEKHAAESESQNGEDNSGEEN